MFQQFKSLDEIVYLTWIKLKVIVINFIEFMRVIFHYYGELKFLKIDLKLIISYFFNNPYQVSKQFLSSKRSKNLYAYGETPLTTLELIAKECQLSVRDTVFELGCGRGRTCFWLHHFIGCQVVGIDYVPQFIERANEVKALFHLSGIEFRLENFLETNFSRATIIYLYGSCYSTSFIKQLVSHLETLPLGTKVVTVSYPLTNYQKKPSFKLLKQFPAKFTWGVAEVYLQIKK